MMPTLCDQTGLRSGLHFDRPLLFILLPRPLAELYKVICELPYCDLS